MSDEDKEIVELALEELQRHLGEMIHQEFANLNDRIQDSSVELATYDSVQRVETQEQIALRLQNARRCQ